MKCKIISGKFAGSWGTVIHSNPPFSVVDVDGTIIIVHNDQIENQINPVHTTGNLVVIESPFSGDVQRNVEYARQAMRRVIESGNTPFASHLLYTQVLDDSIPQEREIGIRSGLAIYRKADECAVFAKYGCSSGMKTGILAAIEHGVPIRVYDDEKISGMVTNKTVLEWMK